MWNGIGSRARFGETFWRISILGRVMRVVSAMSAVSPLALLTDFVATRPTPLCHRIIECGLLTGT